MNSYVQVIGSLWMPGVTGATEYQLSAYDVANIQAYGEHLTGDAQLSREAIEHWLSLNSGDFRGIDDFRAVIGAFETDWADEDSACVFNDCMYPSEYE